MSKHSFYPGCKRPTIEVGRFVATEYYKELGAGGAG